MKKLTLDILKTEATRFCLSEDMYDNETLYGITDGKAIGTYIEHKFKDYLSQNYCFEKGSSASGIDFPQLQVDIKVTSIVQPQSSCPFRSARQKIYGLGYNLLIFVYNKEDKHSNRTSRLNVLNVIFLDKIKTADFQLTTSIHNILENNGNRDDLISLLLEKNLPVDEITINNLADEILINKPQIGYLTISNALQWRLQYTRAIENAGNVQGIDKLV